MQLIRITIRDKFQEYTFAGRKLATGSVYQWIYDLYKHSDGAYVVHLRNDMSSKTRKNICLACRDLRSFEHRCKEWEFSEAIIRRIGARLGEAGVPDHQDDPPAKAAPR